MSTLLEGTELGGYKIGPRIGNGSYKDVYLAEWKELPGEKVALLVTDVRDISEKGEHYLKHLGRTALENCRSEAGKLFSLNKLRNPNIPIITGLPVYDEERGIYYWSEEYVERRLSDELSRKPCNCYEVDSIVSQISNAILGANSRSYFHGDLSPTNIGLSRGIVKILDWGLCSTIPENPSDYDGREFRGYRFTRAPEVYHGEIPTEKADSWAIGVIAYRLLRGRWPFKWSFHGTSEKWRKLPPMEKKRYEAELRKTIDDYCRSPTDLMPAPKDLRDHIFWSGGILENLMHPDPTKRISPKQLQDELKRMVRLSRYFNEDVLGEFPGY